MVSVDPFGEMDSDRKEDIQFEEWMDGCIYTVIKGSTFNALHFAIYKFLKHHAFYKAVVDPAPKY